MRNSKRKTTRLQQTKQVLVFGMPQCSLVAAGKVGLHYKCIAQHHKYGGNPQEEEKEEERKKDEEEEEENKKTGRSSLTNVVKVKVFKFKACISLPTVSASLNATA